MPGLHCYVAITCVTRRHPPSLAVAQVAEEVILRTRDSHSIPSAVLQVIAAPLHTHPSSHLPTHRSPIVTHRHLPSHAIPSAVLQQCDIGIPSEPGAEVPDDDFLVILRKVTVVLRPCKEDVTGV